MAKQLNILEECKTLRMGVFTCPPFLVLLMGFFTIVTMVVTYLFFSSYVSEPEVAALIVIFITAIFIVIGNLIVASFTRIAEASRLKSEFISIVSHELRSPLSVLKWTLDALNYDLKKDGNPKMDGNAVDFFLTLKDTNEKMIKLVNSLLEVSRIDSQDYIFKKEPLSLVELTQKVIGEFKEQADLARQTVNFSAPQGLPQILGDYDRLLLVVRSLLDNAIRYSAKPGTINIKIEKNHSRLRWSITDEGVGIPASQQKNIFTKVFRAGNILKYQTRGSGLSLFIARAIIEGLGGKMGFGSREGMGSTFWFWVPINVKI